MPGSDLKPGDTIASYRVLRKLGEGGMGAVYEAIQDFTQRRAAVKLLHSFRADEDYKARFMQEARALAQQDHPNVVRLIDANITPKGDIWIAMEYLEGCTLREYCVRTGPMQVPIALHHLIEICDGVAAGHEIGIVHCDLKPENVFITKQGATKVVDFGAARAPSLGVIRSTAAVLAAGGKRSVLGTPEYMSPEHLQSRGARERTDVFAIGTMGWEMLAGRHWMSGVDGSKPHLWEVVRQQIDHVPPLVSSVVPQVPEYVALILHRAMEKDQELRWPRVADLAEALRDALARYCKEGHEDPRDAPAKQKWIGPGAWAAQCPPVSLPLPSPPMVDPSSRVLVQVPPVPAEQAPEPVAALPAPPPIVAAPPAIVAAPPAIVAAPPAIVVAPGGTQEILPAPVRNPVPTSKTEELPLRTTEPAVAQPPPVARPDATTPASMVIPAAEIALRRAAANHTTVPRGAFAAGDAPPPRVRSLRVLAMGFFTGTGILAGVLTLWLWQRSSSAVAEGAVDAGSPSPDAALAIVTAPEIAPDASANEPAASPDAGVPDAGGGEPAVAPSTPATITTTTTSSAPQRAVTGPPRSAPPPKPTVPRAPTGSASVPKVSLPFPAK